MQRLQSGEIEIAAVHDDDRACRPVNQVEHIDVVHVAGGDMDENRNAPAQIDDGMGFDRRLGCAEVRPRKQRQTQVDGRGVQRIERFLETQANVVALIQLDRYCNQPMTKCLEQSPVASLVGIGKGGAGYLAAKPDVVELGALRVQTCHQIAQAFAACELGVRDAQKMIPGREVSDAMIRSESIDQMLEVTEGNKTQQLRENRLAAIHGVAPFAKKTGNDTGDRKS